MFVPAIAGAFATACSPGALFWPAPSVPQWVMDTPRASGSVYAVGIVGKTYFPEDGRLSAADEARKELARSVSSRVASVLLHVEETRGTTFLAEAGVVSATSLATDVVLSKSQIQDYWTDVGGLFGQPGSTYALAVISTTDLRLSLEERTGHLLIDQDQVLSEDDQGG